MSQENVEDFKITLKGQIYESINKIKKIYNGKAVSDMQTLKVVPLDAKEVVDGEPTLKANVKTYLTEYKEFLKNNFVDGIDGHVIEVLNEIIEELTPKPEPEEPIEPVGED